MDRQANYIFFFVLLTLFILEAHSDDHGRILTALLLAFSVSVIAFLLNWLTLDGLFAAAILGAVILGLGGWTAGFLLVIFFFTSSLLTVSVQSGKKPGDPQNPNITEKDPFKSRRTGLQIWANGFWAGLTAILFFLMESPEFLVMTAAAIATATSDTWATEIGRRGGGETVRITDFKKIIPGGEGGISTRGTIGGFAGAMLIAICYLLLSGNFFISHFLIITLSGFSGCLADSYLGAIYQTSESAGSKRRWIFGLERMFASPERANNSINWLASATGVLISFLLIQIA